MPTFQNYLSDNTILTELVSSDEALVNGLKNRQYDMVILHTLPDDKSLFCQRFMEEQIYISISNDHPLARQSSVSFSDLSGIRILVSAHIGFWMDICNKHLNTSDLLVQNNADALDELADNSTIPLFNSDRMIELGYNAPGRISIPI